MKTFIRNQHGFVVFVSLIMVMISLGYTVGYLHFVMGERILFSQRLAETRARYNALSGISEQVNALIRGPNFNTANDTTLDDAEIDQMLGGYRDVQGMMKENLVTHRSQRHGRATGWSTYNSFVNESIEVEYTMEVNYRARGFEEFMYLTNEEMPGGGPWLGTTGVTFGNGEILEGLVYSNDDLTMSNFGCPQFVNYETDDDFEQSQVYTAGIFNYSTPCQENNANLFAGVHADSMPRIAWPPYEGQDLIRSKADYIYHGNALINTMDIDHKDWHIMTHLEFSPGQIFVKQWKYLIPPIHVPQNAAEQDLFLDSLMMYYPKFYRDNFAGGSPGVFLGDIELQHFDFFPPANPADLIIDDVIMAPEAVIWIDGGQVQVEGEIQGRYTVATSSPEPYKMYHDSTLVRELNCNIWIMDDIWYTDSNPTTKYVTPGSPNRLGLLSGGNIIVANTTANGKRNGGVANGNVRINAAMIAMNESFIIQYWQNSTTLYNFVNGGAIKGDGRSVSMFRPPTGATDIRGTVMIYGSVVQEKRGYLKRNNPGPYAISPGIGYEKDYHYDRNLRTFPPPEWPETKNSDGSSSLELSGIGEYLGE